MIIGIFISITMLCKHPYTSPSQCFGLLTKDVGHNVADKIATGSTLGIHSSPDVIEPRLQSLQCSTLSTVFPRFLRYTAMLAREGFRAGQTRRKALSNTHTRYSNFSRHVYSLVGGRMWPNQKIILTSASHPHCDVTGKNCINIHPHRNF